MTDYVGKKMREDEDRLIREILESAAASEQPEKIDDSIAQGKRMNWIKVEDRLPPLDAWIMGYGSVADEPAKYFQTVVKASWDYYRKEMIYDARPTGCSCCDASIDITHWMPLPNSPDLI